MEARRVSEEWTRALADASDLHLYGKLEAYPTYRSSQSAWFKKTLPLVLW